MLAEIGLASRRVRTVPVSPRLAAPAALLALAAALLALVGPGCRGGCDEDPDVERVFALAWRKDADGMRALLDRRPELANARSCHGWDLLDGMTGRRTGTGEMLFQRLFRRLIGSEPTAVLHVAARQGDAATVGVLVSRGAELDPGNEVAQTPLHLAARYGHAAAAESLLAHGAQVDSRAAGGYTPLSIAAGHGRAPVVELLLGHGADLHFREPSGWTPLHRAASDGHASVVRLLLAHGAPVDVPDNHGNTPLQYATQGGHRETVKLLASRGARVAAQGSGHSPLTTAILNPDPAAVRDLLERGAYPDEPNGRGETPLEVAIGGEGKLSASNLEDVRILLEAGASVQARWKNGDTPLHRAAWYGHTEMAALLIEHGAVVDARNDWGWTPLHAAAGQDGHEVAELLITAGADVNARNRSGQTPLDLAWGDERMKALLRRHGAR